MPQHFTDLLTPAGLGFVIVLIVAGLKRLQGPDWIGKLGDLVRQYKTATSLIVGVLIVLVAAAVVETGHTDVAEVVWQYFLLAWVASQGLYNFQKAAANSIRR